MAFDSNQHHRDTGYSTPSGSTSFFGKTIRIEGEISSEEDLVIEGRVNGDVKTGKTLIIGKDGYVNGNISASVVCIGGKTEGHISASEKLEVSAEGRCDGTIRSGKIQVEEGAKLKVTVNQDDERPQVKDQKPLKKEEPISQAVAPIESVIESVEEDDFAVAEVVEGVVE
ncbi:MAG: bactofilin family protein [Candidatus Omnitrophota bacterium]